MTFTESLEQALRSASPLNELRSLAMGLFSQGHNREAILSLFEEARGKLRQANREMEEDIVMDVMDCLVGWCSPSMKLPPDQEQSQVR